MTDTKKPVADLSMFTFVEVSRTETDDNIKRRNYMKNWVKHQYAMFTEDEEPKNSRDKCEFMLENGQLVFTLRYGTVPLKGLPSPKMLVKPDPKLFVVWLLDAIDAGALDEALALTAKRERKPKEAKSAATFETGRNEHPDQQNAIQELKAA